MKRCFFCRLLCALLLSALLLPAAVSAVGSECYPACPAGETSLVDALKAAGDDASFSHRASVARANGMENYSGTAEQNVLLLKRMKAGKLLKPGHEAETGPLAENLSRTAYIRQDAKTCKATALAMALNLLTGSDGYTTKSMGSSLCSSIDGKEYRGSDGSTYKGVYKTDGYVGSREELTTAIDGALSAGLPVVAAVHSTKSGGTRHHWVLIIGHSGGDYLMVDPAWGKDGTIADNSAALSSRHYALGLADYDTPHYGYVAFAAIP